MFVEYTLKMKKTVPSVLLRTVMPYINAQDWIPAGTATYDNCLDVLTLWMKN